MKYKIIIFDIGKTLLDKQVSPKISERTLADMKALQDKGIKVGVCTMRTIKHCREIIPFELDFYTAHFSIEINIQIMINKFNIFARHEAPIVLFNFVSANATEKFRNFVFCAISTFVLPSMVDVCRSLNLLITQEHLFLALVLNGIFNPSAKIHKENFILAVAQSSAVVFATLLVLIQDPKGNADIGGNKEFTRENDDSFYLVILNQFLANFQSVTISESAVGKEKTCYAFGCLQM